MEFDKPLVYRVDEAARMLSIPRSKAYELIAKGEIPHIRIGSSVRVPAAALDELVAQLKHGAREEKLAMNARAVP